MIYRELARVRAQSLSQSVGEVTMKRNSRSRVPGASAPRGRLVRLLSALLQRPLSADPLESIRNTRKIRMVIKHGEVVQKP